MAAAGYRKRLNCGRQIHSLHRSSCQRLTIGDANVLRAWKSFMSRAAAYRFRLIINSCCSSRTSLLEVACQTLAGFIWINFVPRQSLTDWLRPLTGRFQDWDVETLRIARQIDYEVNANWKLIFQNYSECYHCPTVHPVLNRLTQCDS